MHITAQDVNKLRQLTNAGMMDCKKALIETGGNFDKAIEILRKKGQKVSAARADNAIPEGAVFAKTDDQHQRGIILALGCETDFVAKNDIFQNLGNLILQAALDHHPDSIEKLKAIQVGDRTIQDHLLDHMGKIGEKIEITAYRTLNSDIVVPYIHTSNKLGVLIGLMGADATQGMQAGRDVAMQIAAMNPIAVDKDHLAPHVLEKEMEIAIEQTRAQAHNKPQEVLEKIAQGRINKFLEENTLLKQTFVKDNSLTVEKYLQQVSPSLTVTDFVRVAVGRS